MARSAWRQRALGPAPIPLLPTRCPPAALLLPLQTCAWFVLAGQLIFGVLLPLYITARTESAAAVEFARRHGMPADDRRLRLYRALHRATAWPL